MDDTKWSLNIEPCDDVLITTTPSVTNVSQQLVTANPYRKGFYIWNNSANSLYVKFGSVASSASPAIIVASFQSHASLGPTVWTGAISGIRNGAATGTVTITELQ